MFLSQNGNGHNRVAPAWPFLPQPLVVEMIGAIGPRGSSPSLYWATRSGLPLRLVLVSFARNGPRIGSLRTRCLRRFFASSLPSSCSSRSRSCWIFHFISTQSKSFFFLTARLPPWVSRSWDYGSLAACSHPRTPLFSQSGRCV